MTHEKIHTIHLTPHITWQGTRAELEAMQAEGWPLAEARAERIEELEAKLAKAVVFAEIVERTGHGELEFLAGDMLAELKGQNQ